MKKTVFTFFILLLITTGLFSLDLRAIKISYNNSRRLTYSSIELDIRSDEIRVKTRASRDSAKYAHSNRDYNIKISREKFEELYNFFISLNIREIIEANDGILGLDGYTFEITTGTFNNNFTLHLWTPEDGTEKRKLTEVYKKIKEIFKMAKLEEQL